MVDDFCIPAVTSKDVRLKTCTKDTPKQKDGDTTK